LKRKEWLEIFLEKISERVRKELAATTTHRSKKACASKRDISL
jgi:hypothetical protein